jgi:hypothetical protein
MERGGASRWLVVALAVTVAAAVIVLVVVVTNDDQAVAPTVSTETTGTTGATGATGTTETTRTTETTGPTVSTETTTPVTTVPTTAPPVGEDVTTAVWPWADSTVRYTDPVEAALGFAVDYVGFIDPIVGEFRAGDPRSGEVEVRPIATFAPTVVLVRQLGTDGTWWVLGSTTENVVIERPDALESISSPLTLSGTSQAFEGTIDVEVRADGDPEPLAVTFVTGGGFDQPAPFEGAVQFENPGAGSGALVLTTSSSEDGRVLEAAVLRISFAPS